ncbi:hypothetical protein ACJJTC_013751 [Scirpophaga incertulas]
MIFSVGEIIATLLVALFKILVCVVGLPGRTGTPDCCKARFGAVWGVETYSGAYLRATDIIEYYDLLDIEEEIQDAIDDATDGKGVVALRGNARFIVQWLLEIVALCKKSRFSEADFVTIVVNLVTITGAIGNSCKVGLGEKLVADLLTKLSISLNVKVLAGVNLKTYVSVAQKRISVCKQDRLYGAVNLQASASIKI